MIQRKSRAGMMTPPPLRPTCSTFSLHAFQTVPVSIRSNDRHASMMRWNTGRARYASSEESKARSSAVLIRFRAAQVFSNMAVPWCSASAPSASAKVPLAWPDCDAPISRQARGRSKLSLDCFSVSTLSSEDPCLHRAGEGAWHLVQLYWH